MGVLLLADVHILYRKDVYNHTRNTYATDFKASSHAFKNLFLSHAPRKSGFHGHLEQIAAFLGNFGDFREQRIGFRAVTRGTDLL